MSEKFVRFYVVIVAAWLSGATAVQAAEQSFTIAGMSVTVWSEGTDTSVKRPVIIFSHGFHGCATQSRFLMEAFASAGYLVFAPNHQDATCKGGGTTWTGKPELPFGQPETWDATSYRDRADDIRRLIEAIRTDDRFRTRVDALRIGLAGHSLGGYTVLGLVGAWPNWTYLGIKAVLALSPYSQPFVLQHTLAALSVPVMYQGGTRDLGITPTLGKSMGSYDQSPPPKYYVEFDKAGHLAWTNIIKTAHAPIVRYSVAFMNLYVKGAAADPLLTRALPGVALFRYESELGAGGSAPPDDPGKRGARGRLPRR